MCRSKWKGNFFSFNFYNTFFNSNTSSHYTLYQKNIIINKKLISHTFLVYNGYNLIKIIPSTSHLNKKFGELMKTRRNLIHKKKKKK